MASYGGKRDTETGRPRRLRLHWRTRMRFAIRTDEEGKSQPPDRGDKLHHGKISVLTGGNPEPPFFSLQMA